MCIATTLGSLLSPPESRPICLHSVQVAWAHPKFGGLLASCSFDHKVILWKQQPDGSWVPVSFASTKCPHSQAKLEIRCCDALMLSKTPPMHMQMAALSSQCTPAALNVCCLQVHESTVHTASVNGVAFAPYELGLQVAAASSDGSFSVHSYDSQSAQWGTVKVSPACFVCCAVHCPTAAGIRRVYNPPKGIGTIALRAGVQLERCPCLPAGGCPQPGLHSCELVPSNPSWLPGLWQACHTACVPTGHSWL